LSGRVGRGVKEVLGENPEVYFIEKRYELIHSIVSQVMRGERPLTLSDLLDKIFLHRAFGIPIFLALWWALFRFTFDVSAPFSDMIDMAFSTLGDLALTHVRNPFLASFLADGVCAGFGSVLVFIPPIFFMFLGLAVLEDTGYLARAAFVMDRVMYRLGLHGRSFIPMLIGFGCNVPAIMATRTIDTEQDRILTILVNPLMSCSARLPVYVLIAGAVLGAHAAAGIYSMYLLGIALAICMALLFRAVIPYFKAERPAFIMELPLYAVPTGRGLLIHMWERGRYFLKKAGAVIFTVMIVVWFLSTNPWAATQGGAYVENSYVAMLGRALEPVFRPLGFDWRCVAALFFGFLAKEIVVETFGLLTGAGEEAGLREAVSEMFTPVRGLAFMAFTLIYIPCVATIGVVYRETNSVKWTVFTVVYGLLLAYAVSLLIVSVGGLLGFT